MKKFSLFLSLLTMTFSLIISSCSSDEENNRIEENTAFPSYKIIGIYHNENLDYIYDAIKEQSEKLKTRSKTDLRSIITEDFLARSISEFANITETMNFKQYSKEINQVSFPIISSYYQCHNPSTRINTQELFEEKLSQYNDTQKKYINMILSAPEIDVCGFQSNIEKIILKMEKDENLDYNERQIIYIASAGAYGSYEYWTENLSKWEELSGSDHIQTRVFSWSNMWQSDVEGTISGGIGGAIAGGSVSMGTLTVPGWAAGAVGGGVGGSAANAVGQIFF